MGIMTDFARPDGVASRGLSGDGGPRPAGDRRHPGMVGPQRPDLRRRRPLRARRLQRAGARSLQGPADHVARRGQSPDDRPRFPRCDAPGFARCRAAPAGAQRQGRGDGLLHGRGADDRRRGACARDRRRGVLLRHPAQGIRRPGQDPRAVPRPFRQPGRLVHPGRWSTISKRPRRPLGSSTRSTATTPPTPFSTSAAPPTTSPPRTWPGTACRRSSKRSSRT